MFVAPFIGFQEKLTFSEHLHKSADNATFLTSKAITHQTETLKV